MLLIPAKGENPSFKGIAAFSATLTQMNQFGAVFPAVPALPPGHGWLTPTANASSREEGTLVCITRATSGDPCCKLEEKKIIKNPNETLKGSETGCTTRARFLTVNAP